MGIPFQVDPRSATPIYDQIATQVKHAVAAGRLRHGDALPSVRQLAVELRVNPNTVARAYRELESEGVVESRQGAGTFVAEGGKRLTAAARRKALEPGVARLVAEAHALGMEEGELAGLVGDAWETLAQRRERARQE